ncbi:MAG TPA: WD40 repeat domain-containing protein [Flavobacteriales bacterium]|nr:WD40 repeat domain-containing protein [Flavobacteriales bacterium]
MTKFIRCATWVFLLLLVNDASGQSTYDQAIAAGDKALDKKHFDRAIDMYFAAAAFDESKSDEVQARVKQVFDAILRLEQRAESSAKEADSLRLVADSALDAAIESHGEAMARYEEAYQASTRNAAVNLLLRSADFTTLPQLRALMAVKGVRSLQFVNEDIRRPDVLNALLGALAGLEETHPIKADLEVPSIALFDPDDTGKLKVLGVDGRVYALDLVDDSLHRSVDRHPMLIKEPPRPISGLDALSVDHSGMRAMTCGAEHGLAVWSLISDSLIGSARSDPSFREVSAIGSFGVNGPFLVGDRSGHLRIWHLEGAHLIGSDPIGIGGIVRDMAYVPALGVIAVANKTNIIHLVRADGHTTTVDAGSNGIQKVVSHPSEAALFIGTSDGKVMRVELSAPQKPIRAAQGSRSTTVYAERNVPIETLALRKDGKRLAFVDAGKTLSIIDPTNRTLLLKDMGEGDVIAYKGVQALLDGLPRSIAFGAKDEVYLGYGRSVKRTFGSVEAICERLCYLLSGASWTWADGTDPSMNNWFYSLGIDAEDPSPCQK